MQTVTSTTGRNTIRKRSCNISRRRRTGFRFSGRRTYRDTDAAGTVLAEVVFHLLSSAVAAAPAAAAAEETSQPRRAAVRRWSTAGLHPANNPLSTLCLELASRFLSASAVPAPFAIKSTSRSVVSRLISDNINALVLFNAVLSLWFKFVKHC